MASMASLSATDVANIVTFVAPGVLASAVYRLVYPQPEASQLRTTVTAVALSLPLVAVVQFLWTATGLHAPRPLQLGYLVVLLFASVLAGYAAAVVRGMPRIKAAIGRLSHPTVRAPRVAEPEATVLELVMGRLEPETWVTVTLLPDSRKLVGKARLWSGPLDVRQQLYLTYYSWWKADVQKFGPEHDCGGVVLDLDAVVAIELSQDPRGLGSSGGNSAASRSAQSGAADGGANVERNAKMTTRWDKGAVVALLAVGVSIAGLIFTVRQFDSQLTTGVHQFNVEQSAAAAQLRDEQRQTTLNDYLDAMSNLVLTHHLAARGKSEQPARALALARTETAVRDLDGARKGTLIRYLWEADLLTSPRPVIKLYRANLDGAVFSHSILHNVSLGSDLLVGANFDGANLEGADLGRADLADARLTGAALTCVSTRVRARPAVGRHHRSFLCANLDGATLTAANLADADALGADLRHADLQGADLRAADLEGADLRGATLTRAVLRGAAYNIGPIQVGRGRGSPRFASTRWPNGFNINAAGAICVDC